MAGTNAAFDPEEFRETIRATDTCTNVRCMVAPLSDDEIVARYLAGFTPSKIAQRLSGRTTEDVRNLLVSRGIALRESQLGRPPRFIDEQDVCTRHRNGETVASIARLYGVHAERIVETLNRLSVPIVKYGWNKNHHRWKGGRQVLKTGYVRITLDRDDQYRSMADTNGAVWEHRYVMACHLGRPLGAHESVHHKDGDRANNELSNLQLRRRHHGIGARFVCNNCGSHDISSEEL
jgi:hypothetical protein